MSENKPMVDTSWELKWRRTLRKKLLNCFSSDRESRQTYAELMYELRKAKKRL